MIPLTSNLKTRGVKASTLPIKTIVTTLKPRTYAQVSK
jgi:hypothetical protein